MNFFTIFNNNSVVNEVIEKKTFFYQEIKRLTEKKLNLLVFSSRKCRLIDIFPWYYYHKNNTCGYGVMPIASLNGNQ
jgi:hypothetical protein